MDTLQTIDEYEGRKHEVIIAVMGATGSGKSTFVRLVTGNEKIVIGESLNSETSRVAPYDLIYGGLKFVIVDTPGFDDHGIKTRMTDRDVLFNLAEWLQETYRDGRRLTGILYLHPITEPRMRGSALKNFSMFRKLCGERAYSNVILGTTFWDLILKFDAHRAEARTIELMEENQYWGFMVKKGSAVHSLSRNAEECRKLLMRMARKDTTVLKIQRELVDQGKSLEETASYGVLVGSRSRSRRGRSGSRDQEVGSRRQSSEAMERRVSEDREKPHRRASSESTRLQESPKT